MGIGRDLTQKQRENNIILKKTLEATKKNFPAKYGLSGGIRSLNFNPDKLLTCQLVQQGLLSPPLKGPGTVIKWFGSQ